MEEDKKSNLGQIVQDFGDVAKIGAPLPLFYFPIAVGTTALAASLGAEEGLAVGLGIIPFGIGMMDVYSNMDGNRKSAPGYVLSKVVEYVKRNMLKPNKPIPTMEIGSENTETPLADINHWNDDPD